jgi:hypothetical protein
VSLASSPFSYLIPILNIILELVSSIFFSAQRGKEVKTQLSADTRSVVSMCYDSSMLRVVASLLLVGALAGCVTTMPALPGSVSTDAAVVIGRAVTVLLGPTTRWFTPELRFFELVNTATQERTRVDVNSDDGWFVLPLREGEYELGRIQISEGAFMAMAGLHGHFQVRDGAVTYVGAWRFGVQSPQYNRAILLSAVAEGEPAIGQVLDRYPTLEGRPIITELPTPSTIETRLYETPPYPRFWWFRRHQTS